MSISLQLLREIADELARERNQRLQVIGVRSGDGEYAEILLSVNECEVEPCRVFLGIFRDASQDAIRAAIAETLRQHFAFRQSDSDSTERRTS